MDPIRLEIEKTDEGYKVVVRSRLGIEALWLYDSADDVAKAVKWRLENAEALDEHDDNGLPAD